MADLIFREARESDLPRVVAMLADDPLGAKRERTEDPLPDVYREALAEIQALPGCQVIVAERDGQVVGCLQITVIPNLSYQGSRRAIVEGVRIDRSYRGQGLGEALFRYTIDLAWQAGCRLVQLTADRTRADAHRFYERLGFEPTHLGMKLDLESAPKPN